jgi:hypothetical protein
MDAFSWFGPYRLVRELEPARLADLRRARRWAAVHERDHTGQLVYSLGPARDRFAKKRFLAAAERLSPLRHPHLLPIEAYALSDKLGACLVAPYSGHLSGVLSLGELVAHKGGRMTVPEATRAAVHLLEALAGAHAQGICDGALAIDRIHVDPRGSLVVELFGLWRCMHRRDDPTPEDFHADVVDAAAIVHQLVTGAPPRRNARGSSPDAHPEWCAWLARALDPVEGFATAADAIASLPGPTAPHPAPPSPGLVRGLIGRIRAAMPLL